MYTYTCADITKMYLSAKQTLIQLFGKVNPDQSPCS